MYKSSSKYSAVIGAVSAAVMMLCGTGESSAATIFKDGFELGKLGPAQNGAAWGSSTRTAVISGLAYTGSDSLQFSFYGGADGTDAFAEQRITLPQRQDYWFKYRLYIPSNYYHRSDGASNNKFLAVYRAPYESPGFQVNFSLEPNGTGGSSLEIHHYNNGSEQSVKQVAANFIGDADKGKWHEIIAEVKAPTSATSNDGIMKLWKDGVAVASVTNLASWGGSGANYINEAYFLGWSNSGFDSTTLLDIDDVEIADTPIGSKAPEAPALSVK